MKYKLLLIGKNKIIKNEFFDHMKVDFDMITSSMRYEDLAAHLELFKPNIVMYCLYNETKDDINKLTDMRRKLREFNTAVGIIGTKDDCEEFQRLTILRPDIVLTKPLTVEEIQKMILDYIEEKEEAVIARKLELEEKKQKERLEMEKQKEENERRVNQFRRKHILVIDDDPMMLKLIKEHLHEKYDVATAISGKIACKFLENKSTDLILLDYEMPVENGPAILQKIRARNETRSIPVVFLTGITDKEKISKALSLHPRGYLLKPIEKDKLMQTIKSILG